MLIMAHFLSGAIWMIVINRKVETGIVREQWTKYMIYLLLFNILWHSIVWFESLFPILGYLIMFAGLVEWLNAIKSNSRKIWLAMAFMLVMAGFWRFLYLDKTEILYTFFVVVLFDGSCQVVGQLVGKRNLFPKISPRKTVEGLVGGTIVTLATSLLVKNIFFNGYRTHPLLSA